MAFEDAALLISACKRPNYLQQALTYWSNVPEINEFRHITIALGRSPREGEQEHLIEQWKFAVGPPVRIRWDSAAAVVSPGMHRALGEAMRAEFANDPGTEFLVCSEEDIIVSDDVLKYMAWARDIAESSHPEVLTISAHNPLGQGWLMPYDDSGADQEAVQLHPKFHPWCWGTWRKQWDELLHPNWDWEASTGTSWHDNGYDWQICRVMDRNGLYALTPDASRSQNIGQYEGYYAIPGEFRLTQAHSFREHRENPRYRLVA